MKIDVFIVQVAIDREVEAQNLRDMRLSMDEVYDGQSTSYEGARGARIVLPSI